MSLKAKLEAIIYAAEEPITLTDITALVKDMVLAEETAEKAHIAAESSTEETTTYTTEPVAEGDAVDVVPAEPTMNAEEADASAEVAGPEAPKKKKKEQTEDQRIKAKVREMLDALIAAYESPEHGMEIRQVAGGYRMATKPEHHDVVRAFAKSLKPPVRLSLAALETLAVIAYKQPITVPEISEIRGVESAGVIGTLLDRKLITTGGRKQVIGRPILYKTTKEFLMRFGLDNVSELPSMEEFEKIASDGQGELFTPEAPQTSDITEGTGEPVTVEEGAEAANTGIPVAEQAEDFPEPQPLLTPAAKLPGTDGRKMSKSYGNFISLSDPEPVVRQKLKTMVTDPARVRRSDPGNPDVCPVGDLHKIFSDKETLEWVYAGCRSAGIGCIECKSRAADNLLKVLNPMQERRRPFEEKPKLVWDILEAGSAKARGIAEHTMELAREAAHLSHEYEAPQVNSAEGTK